MDYTPTESSKIIKLEKGKENTATFEYRYTGVMETITSTVTNVVPGTTRTETVVSEVEETVIIPGAAQPSGVTANVVNNASNLTDNRANGGGNAANLTATNLTNNVADNSANNADQNVDNGNVEIRRSRLRWSMELSTSKRARHRWQTQREDESTVSGDVDGKDADLAAQEIDVASVPVVAGDRRYCSSFYCGTDCFPCI